MIRRSFVRTFAFVLLAAVAAGAGAQTWPAKPVRLVVPFPPGSAPDIIARLMSEKLGAMWSQPIVVDNRPGAGGIVAMAGFVRSPADGYTLMLAPASTVTLTPHLFKDPQFNVDRDLVTIASVGLSPMMIAAHPGAGVNSIGDLVQRAKAEPGKVNVSSPSVNTVPHLTTEMLNRAAGIQLYPVPYNGSVGSATAAVTGDAVVTIDGLPPLVPHVKAIIEEFY
jgi:tripartite-type tricarboxylate transporter receptor subunit TctC